MVTGKGIEVETGVSKAERKRKLICKEVKVPWDQPRIGSEGVGNLRVGAQPFLLELLAERPRNGQNAAVEARRGLPPVDVARIVDWRP